MPEGFSKETFIAALMAGGLGLADADRMDVFYGYLMNSQAVQAMFGEPGGDAAYNAVRDALEAPHSELALRKAASMWADPARATTRATQMLETELRRVGEVIAQGLADGRGPRDIARRLKLVSGLDAVRAAQFERQVAAMRATGLWTQKLEDALKTRLLRDRRETIARTEAAYAVADGSRKEAEERGVKYKAWRTVGDDRVSDVCRSNAGAGFVAIGETFPSGVTQPPAHPNCRCHLVYASTPSTMERIDRLLAVT